MRKGFNAVVENNLTTDYIDLLHISVKRGMMRAVEIIAVYRRPTASKKQFYDPLCSFLNNINYTKLPVLILGDFNIDLLGRNSKSRKLINTLKEYCFTPLNSTEATRVSETSETCIDLIFANDMSRDKVLHLATIPAEFSDHHALVFNYKKLRSSKVPKQKILSYIIKPSNIDNFRTCISEISLEELTFSARVKEFLSICQTAVSTCFPRKTILVKRDNLSSLAWHTSDVQNLIKEKGKLYQKAKNSDSLDSWSAYRSLKNQCNYIIRNAKKRYFEKLLENARDNPKKMWKVLNLFIKPSSSQERIVLLDSGHVLEEEIVVADTLNKYFLNAVNIIASSFTSTYTPNDVRYLNVGFKFVDVTESSVAGYLSNACAKGAGLGTIPGKFISMAHDSFTRFMTDMINASFALSCFPYAFKLAQVTPVFKGGDKVSVSNYRPISILPNLSKVLEKAACTQIRKFLDANGLLFKHQHGFRAGHSTATAVVDLLTTIYSLIDENFIVCAVFLDFSKAFDVLNHDILLRKLSAQFGFSKESVEWVHSYLCDRSQCVKIGNTCSPILSLSHGVPQGSLLGPLLFLLFINDFHSCLDSGSMIMYADDSTVVFAAKNYQSLITKVNYNLDLIKAYCDNNRLKLNVSKTKAIIFNDNTNCLHYGQKILLDDNPIDVVTETKYLGFYLDCRLNFCRHVNMVISKLSSCCFVLNRTRSFLPYYHRRLIFNAIAMCHINYCAVILTNFHSTLFNKLDKRFNKVGSALLGCSTHQLNRDNWISLKELSIVHKYVMLFKILHFDHAPILSEYFVGRNISYALRTASDFTISRYNRSSCSKSFKNWGPRFWAKLSIKLRECETLPAFRKALYIWLKTNLDTFIFF